MKSKLKKIYEVHVSQEENYIQELREDNKKLRENLQKCREEMRKKGQSCPITNRRK